MKQPAGISPTQGVKPCLVYAMTDIGDHKQRIIEERLLGFGLADTMLVDALADVAVVPLEALDTPEVNHAVYYHNIHIVQARELQSGWKPTKEWI